MSSIDPSAPSADSLPASTLLVQHYEQLLAVSERMVENALAGHWGAVGELAEQYNHGISTLKELSAPTAADADNCRALIQKILGNDARLRALIEPERNRLNLEMGKLKRQTNVLQAYSAPVLNHER